MKNPYATMKPSTLIVLWLAKLVVCVMLGYAGYAKMSGAEDTVKMFEEIGMGPTGRQLIGGLEILAVILILIPQSAVYGAMLGLSVMTGAVIGHLTVLPIAGLPMALVVLAGCLTVLYIRRHDAEFLRNLTDR